MNFTDVRGSHGTELGQESEQLSWGEQIRAARIPNDRGRTTAIESIAFTSLANEARGGRFDSTRTDWPASWGNEQKCIPFASPFLSAEKRKTRKAKDRKEAGGSTRQHGRLESAASNQSTHIKGRRVLWGKGGGSEIGPGLHRPSCTQICSVMFSACLRSRASAYACVSTLLTFSLEDDIEAADLDAPRILSMHLLNSRCFRREKGSRFFSRVWSLRFFRLTPPSPPQILPASIEIHISLPLPL